jgi:hypothetical protein
MFARKRGETVDQDLDFDTKSQIGKALKEEWLKCKSAQDETPHLQNIMEMLHGDALAPPPDNVDCADWAPGIASHRHVYRTVWLELFVRPPPCVLLQNILIFSCVEQASRSCLLKLARASWTSGCSSN